MIEYLPWILPPVIGAAIGYFTNAVAIRMLFRPLKKVKVLGLPVPFTPGVIPRQRGELAESIGRMVALQLLTPEVFLARLESDRFLQTTTQAVHRFLDGLREKTPRQLAEQLGLPWDAEGSAGWLAENVSAASRSGVIVQIVHGSANSIAADSGRSLVEVVRNLEDSVRPLTPRVRQFVLDNWEPVFDSAAGQLVEWLRTPEIKKELIKRGRTVITYALERLNAVQRMLVTAVQYDRQLDRNLPDIMERAVLELERSLNSPDVRSRAKAKLEQWLEERANSTVGELFGEIGISPSARLQEKIKQDPEVVYRAAGAIADKLSDLGSGEGTSSLVRTVVREVAERLIAGYQDRPVDTILPALGTHQDAIVTWTIATGRRLVGQGVERLLEVLDVRRVVVERINSLDIERVEDLLLGIIRRHLRWINLFGAILGALIGAVQIVLRLFGLS